MSLSLSISSLGAAAGIAAAAAGGFQEHLYRLRQSASNQPTRNGGRRQTVAQHKRKAAKQRAVRRAKRLGQT